MFNDVLDSKIFVTDVVKRHDTEKYYINGRTIKDDKNTDLFDQSITFSIDVTLTGYSFVPKKGIG